ncbi:MAG: 6-carboxytetrahydropterin synthase QueD [Planctomycetota bacterium]
MFELKVTDSFAAAHNLRGYEGECENLHGHNYTVEVVIAAKTLNKLGVVVDFKLIKKELNEVISLFDHSYLNNQPPFIQKNATAENIAREIYNKLKGKFKPARVTRVTVYESEKASASYIGR